MIVRSQEEIDEVRDRAQEFACAAQDHDDTDDWSEAVYRTLRWLEGNEEDPMLGIESLYDKE